MQVVHPESLDGVGGHCPDTVTLGGTIYPCSDGESFEVSRGQAETLASLYDVDLSEIRVGSDDDGDGCPWCDDYSGDHLGQHASSAHPEEWADYKDDT